MNGEITDLPGEVEVYIKTLHRAISPRQANFLSEVTWSGGALIRNSEGGKITHILNAKTRMNPCGNCGACSLGYVNHAGRGAGRMLGACLSPSNIQTSFPGLPRKPST